LRIVFLVERPTQFEAPFFRFAAGDPRHELRVLFTGAAPAAPAFDPELGHTVSWGFDLLDGFPHAIAPARGRARWLAGQLRRGSCELLIANGYTRREYLLAAALARRAGIATALRLDSALWPGPAAAAPEPHAPSPATPQFAAPQPAAPQPAAPHPAVSAAPHPAASGQSPARLRSRRLLYTGLLMHLYDLFLGVGSLTLEYLAACGVPAGRRGLFPYAIDVEQFRARSRLSSQERAAARARLGLAPGEQAVLAVAKLNPREAPWDLLDALPRLPAAVRLLIAGDGPSRAEVERRAAALGPGRAHLLGYVPYAELPALYAAADLFVHPAREERWGVSVAEALACGLPVVASTRVGAAYDLLRQGANGWLYPAGDAARLACCAGQALALDPRVVAAANLEVLAHWDYAASWRHLLDAGERIVGGSAP
jgi:glycosyltransferase involved in cell wall biosynthesis